MKVCAEHVSEVLARYGIVGSLTEVFYLIEHYEGGIEPRGKVIIQAEMNNGEIYIIKFVLENEHPQSLIEEQSIFSEQMRKEGIKTPKRFRYKERYCTNFEIGTVTYAVTVEEYLGEELRFVNYKVIEEIASLMANMHRISETNDYHINGNTIWDIFDPSADISRGYHSFCEYKHCGKYDFTAQGITIHNKIVDLYEQRLARLKKIWPKLPRYATQGDYSINNLVYKNGNVWGIFDYNIAGDEVLVSDLLIEGLFVSYEMDLEVGLTNEDKDQLFQGFIRKYMEVRKLSQDEINVMDDIYAVVFPFWWTRIIYDENQSLLSYLRANNNEKVDQFLKETYELLNHNYFSEFHWEGF